MSYNGKQLKKWGLSVILKKYLDFQVFGGAFLNLFQDKNSE